MEGERRQQKLSSPPSLRQIAVFNMIVVAMNRRPGVEECAREVLRGHSRHPRAVPHRRPRDPRESLHLPKKASLINPDSHLCAPNQLNIFPSSSKRGAARLSRETAHPPRAPGPGSTRRPRVHHSKRAACAREHTRRRTRAGAPPGSSAPN